MPRKHGYIKKGRKSTVKMSAAAKKTKTSNQGWFSRMRNH